MKKDLLLSLRGGEELTLRQQTLLALQLSIPAILAQVSSIAMQYIDSSMVAIWAGRPAPPSDWWPPAHGC